MASERDVSNSFLGRRKDFRDAIDARSGADIGCAKRLHGIIRKEIASGEKLRCRYPIEQHHEANASYLLTLFTRVHRSGLQNGHGRVINQVFKRCPSVGTTTNGYARVPSGRLAYPKKSEMGIPDKLIAR